MTTHDALTIASSRIFLPRGAWAPPLPRYEYPCSVAPAVLPLSSKPSFYPSSFYARSKLNAYLLCMVWDRFPESQQLIVAARSTFERPSESWPNRLRCFNSTTKTCQSDRHSKGALIRGRLFWTAATAAATSTTSADSMLSTRLWRQIPAGLA